MFLFEGVRVHEAKRMHRQPHPSLRVSIAEPWLSLYDGGSKGGTFLVLATLTRKSIHSKKENGYLTYCRRYVDDFCG